MKKVDSGSCKENRRDFFLCWWFALNKWTRIARDNVLSLWVQNHVISLGSERIIYIIESIEFSGTFFH